MPNAITIGQIFSATITKLSRYEMISLHIVIIVRAVTLPTPSTISHLSLMTPCNAVMASLWSLNSTA